MRKHCHCLTLGLTLGLEPRALYIFGGYGVGSRLAALLIKQYKLTLDPSRGASNVARRNSLKRALLDRTCRGLGVARLHRRKAVWIWPGEYAVKLRTTSANPTLARALVQ